MTATPNVAKELRDNANNLRAYMQSVIDQRREATVWGGHYGVEAAAKDALDCVFRMSASVTHIAETVASAIEARSDAAPQSDAAEGESATGKAGDAQ